MESNPKLKNGLYRLWWADGGWALATVGHDGRAKAWFAPATWVAGVPSEKWGMVKEAEAIELRPDWLGSSSDTETLDDEEEPCNPKIPLPAKKLPRKGSPPDSGSKYVRTIRPRDGNGPGIEVDVYDVIEAFGVTCPARQHAAKKLLCAGLRNKASALEDLRECADAVKRAVTLEMRREEEDEEEEVD